jgi:hypothetical protein
MGVVDVRAGDAWAGAGGSESTLIRNIVGQERRRGELSGGERRGVERGSGGAGGVRGWGMGREGRVN